MINELIIFNHPYGKMYSVIYRFWQVETTANISRKLIYDIYIVFV